jgi:hypothetical protein
MKINNRNLMRAGAVALCITATAGFFAGCKTKQETVEAAHVDVVAFTSPTATHKPLVSQDNKHIRVDVASNVNDLEFDLRNFFDNREEYLGKNFYFTRDDVTKGDHTLVKGYAWVETGKDTRGRLFKKLGHHDDEEVDAMSKSEIVKLPGREGEARMYFMKDGRKLLYMDSTPASAIEKGETRTMFRLHGHHGRVAEMNIVVNKE